MEYTLKECLPEAKGLRLAVGIDLGSTLVSKLGTRGQRDRICVGEAVECAANCEEQSNGGGIATTKTVRDLLPSYLQDVFEYNPKSRCYVANDLTTDKQELLTKGAKAYRAGLPVYLKSSTAGITVSQQELPDARAIKPSRPYAP